MANRSKQLVVSQIGNEALGTPGTAVLGTLVLPNTRLMLMPTGDPQVIYVPSGHLFPRDLSNALEWGAGSYEMKAAYDESYILFDSLFAAVNTSGSPATAVTRTWSPLVNAMDAFRTYSAECGQTGAVEKFAYMIFNSLKFSVGKQESPLFTGDLLSQRALPAIALNAAGVSTIASSPVAATSWDAYTGTTLGALTTQMTDLWKVEFSYGPKYSFAAYVNSTVPGWDAVGVGEPIPTSVNVTVPLDVSGTDYAGVFTLAKKRAGTPIFLTVKALGGTIPGGTLPYTMTFAMCLKIVGLPTRTEIGPFAGNTWPCQLFVDSVSNKAIEVTVLNKSMTI